MSFDLALIDGDISIKADGTLREVRKTEKLRQDIVKIILTPLGSVRAHPWYGSNISDDVVGNIIPENMLFDNLSTAISESLDRLVTLQRAQATQQRVDLAELMARIESLEVDRDPRDRRVVNVKVVVIAKNLAPVEETFSVRS